MRQDKGFDFHIDHNNSFENNRQTSKASIPSNGTLFDLQNSMGTNSFTVSRGHKQSEYHFYSFFMRLGHFNVYNILPYNKKVAALAIKISVILANLMGLSLWLWWLTIDFEGIKIFVSSVGVFLWGSMKLYEKYLDLKEKKRKDTTSSENFKNHNHNNNGTK